MNFKKLFCPSSSKAYICQRKALKLILHLHLCHPVICNSVSLVEVRKVKIQGQGLISNRTVNCLTNVEAFSLEAKDIEEVTNRFAKLLQNPRVQQVIRSFLPSITLLCFCRHFFYNFSILHIYLHASFFL